MLQKKKTGEENQPETENNPDEYKFEKKVEKRVRFRYEKKTAEDLLFYRFDKANDMIVKYIDDFNYKLILSTIQIINTSKEASAKDQDSFGSMEVHHLDNYTRFSKNSALETFIDKINVIDDDKEKAEITKNPKNEENTGKPDKSDSTEEKNNSQK